MAFLGGFRTEFLHLVVTRGILPSALPIVLERYLVCFPPVGQNGIYRDVRVKEFFIKTHEVTWVLHGSSGKEMVDWLRLTDGLKCQD
jgi:hypothetical protein